ncbi:MAG: TonB-dependent receptor [Flavobacteriaceae bacterium]
MMRIKVFSCVAVCATMGLYAQQSEKVELDEVVVSAVRVNDSVPMAYSNFTRAQIEKLNLGQDIPMLLNYTPSMVSTSYDGMGIGYTDFRIRGIDNSRINVTINGIPYNDADSQTSFFVNLQDFASSVGSIQIQRGVGASTFGAAAFGASVSIATQNPAEQAYAQYATSVGSFSTFKNTLQVATGDLNGFALEARLSSITSDGYIDRATADLKSYYLNAMIELKEDRAKLNVLAFGGSETTGLSFFGLDRAGLESNRRLNLDGIYYDAQGNERVYPNQTDNYVQEHMQLHYSLKIDSSSEFSLSAHYTDSDGYYEQIQDYDNPFVFFRGIPELLGDGSDYASRANLNSDFFGLVSGYVKRKKMSELRFGLGLNSYQGEQYGEVIAADAPALAQLPFRFYANSTTKNELNAFSKLNATLTDGLSAYVDLQLRGLSYRASGDLFAEGAFVEADEDYLFFNPKLGLSYDAGRSQLFFSYARANREPSRVDFENGSPRPERLDDFELGYRLNNTKWALNATAFFMDYTDQLVLTGALDAFNFPIRENVGSSYRTGLELDASFVFSPKLTASGNLTLSRHRNRDYVVFRNESLESLGETAISFAPERIAAAQLAYEFSEDSVVTLFFKNVSEQFMSNIEHPDSLIDGYSVVDLNFNHSFRFSSGIERLTLTVQLNNLLNALYENNGYFYSFDDQGQTFYGAAFYPQSPRTILTGLTFRF